MRVFYCRNYFALYTPSSPPAGAARGPAACHGCRGGPGGIGGLRGESWRHPGAKRWAGTRCGRSEPSALCFLPPLPPPCRVGADGSAPLLPRRGGPGRPHRPHHHRPTQEHQRGGRHLGGDHGVRGQRQASSGGDGDGDGTEGPPPISSASPGAGCPSSPVPRRIPSHPGSCRAEGGGGL